MMKLTYRDKIIAAVLIAIAICAISFFTLINPTLKDIKTNKGQLKVVEEKKQEIDGKIKQIPKLQESILDTQKNTNKLAENFVSVEDVENALTVDRYMQEFADKCGVKLKSVEMGKSKLAAMNYYYGDYTDSINELRKSADADGSLEAEYNAQTAEQDNVSQRAKESIIQYQYGITIKGTRVNVFKYLAALKEFDKNVLINSVNITDYTFGKAEAEKANVPYPESNDGETVTIDLGEGKEITNTSEVKIVVTLYSVFEMPEPDVESIPAAN